MYVYLSAIDVKCERDVMDEIIPDGLGSDSEDGEIYCIHACMYVSVQYL